MSRAVLHDYIIDLVTSELLTNRQIFLYDVGTSTPISDTIYRDESGGATLPNGYTAIEGEIILYLDHERPFDLVTKLGGIEMERRTLWTKGTTFPEFTEAQLPAGAPVGAAAQQTDAGTLVPPGPVVKRDFAYAHLTHHNVDVRRDFHAIGDGTSHPLSERYASLAAAQVDYPQATALTQEIDWAAIQRALTVVGEGGTVWLPATGLARGYVTRADALLVSEAASSLKGNNRWATRILVRPGANAAALAGDPAADVYNHCNFRDFTIEQEASSGAGSRCVDWTRFSYGVWENLGAQVRAANAICFYAEGNAATPSGSGPYYNAWDKIQPAGTVADAATQKGWVLASQSSDESGASGPNGNFWSNIIRATSLGIVLDIQAGNGNKGDKINAESCITHILDFNNRAATISSTATGGTAITLVDTAQTFTSEHVSGTCVITGGTGAGIVAFITGASGNTLTFDQSYSVVFDATTTYEVYKSKARDNDFSSLRIEGASGLVPVRFRYGSFNNRVGGFSPSSIGSGNEWQNDAENFDCYAGTGFGGLFPLTFQASNLAANTTTQLAPVGGVSSAVAGGFRVPMGARLVAAATAMDGFGAAGVGQVTIRALRDGTEQTGVTHVLNVNNRFGFAKMAPNPGTIGSVNARNRKFRVTAQTDATWDQTSADVYVTVWFVY